MLILTRCQARTYEYVCTVCRVGDTIPSVNTIVSNLNITISNMTVYAALYELVRRGLLERDECTGTYASYRLAKTGVPFIVKRDKEEGPVTDMETALLYGY